MDLAYDEAFDYQDTNLFEDGKYKEYWDKAKKNSKEITITSESAQSLIRNRITTWEKSAS